MKKRWTRALGALACTLCALMVLQLLAGAAENCHLTVYPCRPATDKDVAMGQDLNVMGPDGEPLLRYDLYKVADMTRSQVADTYDFTVSPDFPVEIPQEIENSSVWEGIAQKAAQTVFLDEAGRVKETVSIRPAAENVPIGKKKQDLDPGLYLLIPHKVGEAPKDYVSVQKDGKLVTRFQGEKNSYSFAPELITLPTKAPDENGQINTANPGEWIFDAEVYLKPAPDLLGPIRITKTLLSYGSDSPVTFVYRVQAFKDGKLVYEKIISMDFDEAGTQSILIEDLPVGATVEVEEIYSGASCKFVSREDPEDPTVKAEYPIEFKFVNDFDNTNKGHGILNRFVFVKGEDGKPGHWELNPPEKAEGGEAP